MIRFILIFLFFSFATTVNGEEEKTFCSSSNCYTPIEVLGEGAFGIVYKVLDSQGKDFALKHYKKIFDGEFDSISSINLFKDVEREYQRGQTLNHSNIVKSVEFFYTGVDSGDFSTVTLHAEKAKDSPEVNVNAVAVPERPHANLEVNLVLQYVRGAELNSIREKSIPHKDLSKAIVHFIQALDYAYKVGMLHLDLHGGNVLVSNKNDVMVIDLASFFTFEEINAVAGQLHKEQQQPMQSMTNASITNKNEGKIKRFLNNNLDILPLFDGQIANMAAMPLFDEKKEAVLQIYFDQISTMSIYMLSKSKSKKDRDKLIGEVERLGREYYKNLKNKKPEQFKIYIKKLVRVFT